MKKLYLRVILPLSAAFIFIAVLLLNRSDQKKSTDLKEPAENTGADNPDEALFYEILKTRDPFTGEVPSERLTKARELQLQKFREQQLTGMQAPVPGIGWAERGPDNVGGRTRAVLYDFNDPTGRKVWAGGVGGGLWYTNDISAATTIWNKVSDTLNNLAISCITQGKGFMSKAKMFFGTGEGWANVDAIRGNGIWRSLDAGATWTHLLSTKDNPAFRFILDILYVDNSGGPCGIGTPGVLAATTSGVYKSTNDGDTWTKVLGNGIAGATIDAAADLEASYYYTYATLGLVHQGGGGIYRSCNAGETWEEIYHALNIEQRIEIAEHYLDAWQLYAVIQDTSLGMSKIMKSSNADEVPATNVVWSVKNPPPFCNLTGATEFTNKQAWYDLILAVAPIFRNPPVNNHHETAYIGGVDLNKTINSGSGWSQISEWYAGCFRPYVHADKHNIVFKPDPLNASYFPDEFLVATDGGIFRSTNGGVSYTSRNNSYNITQFYSCAIHPSSTDYFLGGTQDNGTQIFTAAGINSTANIIDNDHDGGFCYIDQDNPQIQIASYLYNYYFISTNGGADFTGVEFNKRGQFINPTDYDHVNNILYCGDNGGKYFRWNNPASTTDTTSVSVTAFNNKKITFVLLSPTVLNRVYFGLDNGAIVQVDDAHTGNAKTGIVIRPDLGSDYFLSCIAVDTTNENHMLASYSNYGVTKIYESSAGTGGSLIWNSVQGDLPDMPVRWCMFDPRNNDWAILATEKGIWSTNNLNATGTTNWSPTNNNFANTRVDMLRYRRSDRLLLAATHGRGMFSSNIPLVVPVTLFDFKGMISGNKVELTWVTATEQNSKGFGIERSYNGTNFTEIGFVPSTGNSNTQRAYNYTDKDILRENNYYRLRQVDNDDKFEYSRVVLVKNTMRSKVFRVLNNPFNNYIDIEFGIALNGKSQLRLMDLNGRILQQEIVENVPQSRHRMIIQKNLSKGIYILQIITGDRMYQQELIKQ